MLFDKDGTLVDFQATWGQATADVLFQLAGGDDGVANDLAARVDFDLGAKVVSPGSILVSGTTTEFAELWSPLLGRPADKAFETDIDRLFGDASLNSVSGFPSTESTLVVLGQSGFRLGVATNDSHDNACRHMDALRWTEHFEMIMGYDSGHGAKPGPGMVAAFAETLAIRTDEIAMIGDSVHDLGAARAANALAVAVTTGPASRDELAPHADHVIDDLQELVELLPRR